MLNIHKIRISVFHKIAVAFVFLQVSFSVCFASDLSPGELLKESMRSIQQENYEDAIGFMYGYLELAAESSSDRVKVIAQDMRFKLATLLIVEDRMDEAAEILEEYISKPYAKRPRQAHKMLVASYLESEQYNECITAVKDALEYNENPKEVERIAEDIDDPFVTDAVAEENITDDPYTVADIETLYFAWGDSYFKLEKLEECIEPYTYVIDNTSNLQRKGYCIMQVVKALTELEKFGRIIEWVPQLYRTPARYDIRVNIALLGVASSLYEAGEYDSALPLYRMIVPRDELIAYQQKTVREMRIDAGLPPEMGEEMTADEELLFGTEDALRTAMEDEEADSMFPSMDDLERKKPRELREIEGLLEALKGMAPYENHVYFQTGQLYKEVERFWEAVKFFDTVFTADPTSAIGERSIYETVMLLMDMLGEREESEKRALAYLDENKKGQYPRLVTYVLIRYYQSEKDWKSIKATAPYIKGFEADENPDIIKFDAEMFFMQAVADLMTQSYSNAVESFQYVMDNYPGTAPEGNSLFWCGFSYLTLDQFENAYECFERYTREFPNGDLLDEAYFQGGIALFGLDRLEEAKERFTYVIDTFGPSSSVYPDSSSRRGDLLGAEGGDALDLAVQDYRNAFTHAQTSAQATYATFQMCEIFKADDAHYGAEPIIQAVNLYLARWGDKGADLSKALLWLGRTKIQQKRFEEAADSYLEAIIDYGGELRQDGVDLMIPELVKLAMVFLKEEQRDAIKTRLTLAMESTDDEVLKLRLRVILAQFDRSELELGKQLIEELPDLKDASPPVLSIICEASFEIKDYSRSEEMLRTFKYNFEDSQYMRSAYKLRGFGQYEAGDYDGAMLTIADTQAEYGTERDAAWAQLMKADILLKQSLMLDSDEPLSEEWVSEIAKAQLETEQGRLAGVNEELLEEDIDEQTEERLIADKARLNEKISGLELAVDGWSSEREARTLLAACKLHDAREENKNVFGVNAWRGEPEAQAIYQLGQVEEAAGNPRLAHGYYQRTYFQYKGHANGYWAAEGYLSSARCLMKMSEEPGLSSKERTDLEAAAHNTYRAMLYDRYVNHLPQADVARAAVGEAEVSEINAMIESGMETNIIVDVDAEAKPDAAADDSPEPPVEELEAAVGDA
jgi:TolA-binding protein